MCMANDIRLITCVCVHVGVSGERLEVDPVSQNKSGFFGRPAKPVRFAFASLCTTEKGKDQLIDMLKF